MSPGSTNPQAAPGLNTDAPPGRSAPSSRDRSFLSIWGGFFWVPLISGGLLLLGSWGFSLWYWRGGQTAVILRQTRLTAESLEKAVGDISRQAARLQLAAQLPNPGFADYALAGSGPAFIYADSTVLYWSTGEFVPPVSQLPPSGVRWQILTLNQGMFIAHQRVAQQGARRLRIVTLLPLVRYYPVRNYYLRPRYLMPELAEVQLRPASEVTAPDHQLALDITDTETGQVIAYLEPVLTPSLMALRLNRVLMVTIGAGAGLLFIAILALSYGLWRMRRHLSAALIPTLALIGLRALLMALGYPQMYTSGPAASALQFGASPFAPTLADVLLHLLLAVGVVWVWFGQLPYLGLGRGWGRKPAWLRLLLAICLTAGAHILTIGLMRAASVLYRYARAVPDLALGLELSTTTVMSVVLLLLGLFVMFLLWHVLGRWLLRLREGDGVGRPVWIGYAIGTLLGAGPALLLTTPPAPMTWIATAALLALSLRLRLAEYLYRLRYQTYFYLFGVAMLGSVAITEAYLGYRARGLIQEKAKITRRLIAEQDPLAIFVLDDARGRILADTGLINALRTRQDTALATLESRIRRAYTDVTLDQYELEVGVFGPGGRLVAGQAGRASWPALMEAARATMRPTGNDSIFYAHLPSEDVFKRYLALGVVRTAEGRPVGYLSLDLHMRRLPATTVFPTLLADGHALPPTRAEQFSYAVYRPEGGGISLQEGQFNYERFFDTARLAEARRRLHTGLREGQEDGGPLMPTTALNSLTHRRQGWEHTLFAGPGGEQIVVSSQDRRWLQGLANFSLMLLVQVGLILVYIVGFASWQQMRQGRTTYAGKIQIYLNGAFFLPLIVFGLITIVLVDYSLEADLNNAYLARARQTARTLEPALERSGPARTSLVVPVDLLEQAARMSGLDLSVYSPKGQMAYSSHPLIYRKGILSGMLNPEVMRELLEEGLHDVLLSEQIGSLRYATAYVAVRRPGTQEVSAVLAVPFFDSSSEVRAQLAQATSTVMITFTVVFILFMALSYLASQALTMPLKLIAARLSRISLDHQEPLYWQARDEIGALVAEYNRMLVKLAHSREALRRTEKETAWRQMAQQVAHEIKNPLTPMRLSVQQLARVAAGAGTGGAPIQRTLDNLLEQIDRLSDIAGQFAAYAQMPMPRTGSFDLARLVRQAVELHQPAMAGGSILYQSALETAPVEGDEGLVAGAITNLILNGRQAVPEPRLPRLRVVLRPQTLPPGFVLSQAEVNQLTELVQRPDLFTGQVAPMDTTHAPHAFLLAISDNGQGLPPGMKSRIFEPGFTTKADGQGFGLALARRAIEHAGGRIWPESRQGEGTTFYVLVPADPATTDGLTTPTDSGLTRPLPSLDRLDQVTL